MGLSNRFQAITLIAWIVIVPPGIFFAFTSFPSREIDWLNLSVLFALLFVTMTMPLQLNNITISLERWITVTIFFQYGVFAEMAFTQIAMLILVFSTKSDLPILHRFCVNSLIFTLISLASGTLFHFAGGIIGSTDFSHICLFGLIYAISYTTINCVLMQVYLYFELGIYSMIEKIVLWDFVTTMMLFPFSLSLYFLYEHLGNNAIILIGIPFLLVLIIARMYNRSANFNDKLSSAGIIGRELAERLGFEDVIQTFIGKLKDVVPYDNAYVLDLKNGEHLITLMASEDGIISKDMNGLSFNLEKTVDDGLDTENPKIYGTQKEARVLNNFKFIQPVESVMTAPIKRNQKTEGFLILTSKRKNVFQTMEMKIVDVLTGYFAISLVKARFYEKTVEQSERCGLTNLHNFRFLDATLDEEITRFQIGDINSLSVLMLDIDHFKAINDTHGHQSGNELLKALARLLESFVPLDATLSRYGGEEFVIVMPNFGKTETAKLVEEIREKVELSTFHIIPDLTTVREPVDIHMTVSIGVACVPEDAGDAKELLRKADRALYIGGKQAGRNKVGVYGKEYVETVLC